jgi:hypothetical protein
LEKHPGRHNDGRFVCLLSLFPPPFISAFYSHFQPFISARDKVLTKLNETLKDVVEGKTDDEKTIAELLNKAQVEVDKVLAGEAA